MPFVHGDEPKPTTYDDHVAAIFKRHCLQCHGDAKQESGLNLANYAAVMKGGSGGAVVVSGRSSGSRLFQAITAEDPAERMPPNNDALPKEQVALIKAWIDTGLRQNSGSAAAPTRTLGFTPTKAMQFDGPPPMPGKLPDVEAMKTTRPFPILALAASPRAPLVAAAAYERVDLLDPTTRRVLGSLAFPEGEPHGLRFSRSGGVLLVAGGRPVQNGRVVLFDVATGKRLAELGDEPDVVMAADISPDESRVAIGGSGRVVKLLSTIDGKVLDVLVKHTDWITALAFSPDGKLLATGDRAGNIQLWDAVSGGIVLPLAEHKAAVRGLSWRSDSEVLASCADDGQIVWWNVGKGWPAMSKADAHPPRRPSGVYGKIPNGVLDASFGPRGELVTTGRDQVVRLWSADGTEMKAFPMESASDRSPASRIGVMPLRAVISFDGKTVVSGDSAGMVRSWPIVSE